MQLETTVSSDDLDDPPEQDTPITGVYVTIMPPDGMRYSTTAFVEGTATAEQVAEMLQAATSGAAEAYAPRLREQLAARWAGRS